MGHDHAHEDDGSSGGSCHHGSDLSAHAAETLAECPVMRGSTVVKADAEAKGLFRDYEGERYWLCCTACEAPFDADPAKYAAAV